MIDGFFRTWHSNPLTILLLSIMNLSIILSTIAVLPQTTHHEIITHHLNQWLPHPHKLRSIPIQQLLFYLLLLQMVQLVHHPLHHWLLMWSLMQVVEGRSLPYIWLLRKGYHNLQQQLSIVSGDGVKLVNEGYLSHPLIDFDVLSSVELVHAHGYHISQIIMLLSYLVSPT